MTADAAIEALSLVERFASLTGREREVILAILAGKDRLETSNEIGISTRTYDSHRRRALVKVGARNNVTLTLLAIRCGFASMHDTDTEAA